MTACIQRLTYCTHNGAQERERWPRGIQTSKPSAEGGSIGQSVGVLNHRRRRFPATAVHKVATQCLAAGDQTVVAVRWGVRRQESERLPALTAKAAADLNPIVIFVMCLLPATAMADDRIAQTDRASAKDRTSVRLGPLGFEVVLRCRK
jgi:hypothetical protein